MLVQVLGNDEPVSGHDHVGVVMAPTLETLVAEYHQAEAIERRARVAPVLESVGAGAVLDAPDVWRLWEAVDVAEDRWIDAGAVLGAQPPANVDAAVGAWGMAGSGPMMWRPERYGGLVAAPA